MKICLLNCSAGNQEILMGSDMKELLVDVLWAVKKSQELCATLERTRGHPNRLTTLVNLITSMPQFTR